MDASRSVTRPTQITDSDPSTPARFVAVDTEQSIRSKVRWLTTLFFLKSRKDAADSWSKTFTSAVPVIDSAATYRQKVIADASVSQEVVSFKEAIDAERVARAEKRSVLSKSEHAQTMLLSSLSEMHKEKIDAAYECATIGFRIANDVIHIYGDVMDSELIEGTQIFKSAYAEYKAHHAEMEMPSNAVATEIDFIHWVTLAIKCHKLDSVSKEMALLDKLIEMKTEELKNFKATQKKEKKTQPTQYEDRLLDLKDTLAELKTMRREKQKYIRQLKQRIAPGVLRMITRYGAGCAYGLQTILKAGSSACKNITLFTKGLSALKGVIAADDISYLVTCMIQLFNHSSNVSKMNAQLKQLDEYEAKLAKNEQLSEVNQEANLLMGAAIAMKKKHLLRSHKISRTAIALNILSSAARILTLGKAGVVFYSILSATVLVIPGLNLAAAIIGMLAGLALVANSAYHLKRDKAGVKLDVQIAEISAKLSASAGAFHLAAIKYQSSQLELHSVRTMEKELRGAIAKVKESFDKKLEEAKKLQVFGQNSSSQLQTETYQEIFDFYTAIIDEMDSELEAVLKRKLDVEQEYNTHHMQLYSMSLELDKIVFRKDELEAARAVESISQEFTRDVQKEALIEHQALFADMLQHPETEKAFVKLLMKEGIPVTAGHTFGSILDFIRDDDAMPKSSETASQKAARKVAERAEEAAQAAALASQKESAAVQGA